MSTHRRSLYKSTLGRSFVTKSGNFFLNYLATWEVFQVSFAYPVPFFPSVKENRILQAIVE